VIEGALGPFAERACEVSPRVLEQLIAHRAGGGGDGARSRARLEAGLGPQVGRLVRADDLEARVDEDVVRPVDADVVDLVLAVAQLDHTVNDAPGVGGQRGFGRLVRSRSADDRP
jgi:hypothetical protein